MRTLYDLYCSGVVVDRFTTLSIFRTAVVRAE